MRGDVKMMPFFCPHSPAYPALESQEGGRTERRDHWQERAGRRMIPFFATHVLPAQTTESVMKRPADEGVRAPCGT
jgi:hypothetical protein